MQVLPIFSEFVNCWNGLYDLKDLRDYGWKEHEGKFIAVWFQGEPLRTLKEIEPLEENKYTWCQVEKGWWICGNLWRWWGRYLRIW